jgi:hypothetical protein
VNLHVEELTASPNEGDPCSNPPGQDRLRKLMDYPEYYSFRTGRKQETGASEVCSEGQIPKR